MSRFKTVHLGPLPVSVIRKTLEIDLEPGNVVFSAGAQRHAWRGHSEEFDELLPFAALIIKAPTYVGDDHRNPGKIELIRRLPNGRGALIALVLEPDTDGNYHVASMYSVPQSEIDKRRLKRYLRVAIG